MVRPCLSESSLPRPYAFRQYIALTAWVKDHPSLANRFARAVVKGAEFANASGNEAAVREANQQFTNLNPAMKDKVRLPRLGTRVNEAEIRRTMDLMLKYGLMKKPVDLAGRTLAIQ